MKAWLKLGPVIGSGQVAEKIIIKFVPQYPGSLKELAGSDKQTGLTTKLAGFYSKTFQAMKDIAGACLRWLSCCPSPCCSMARSRCSPWCGFLCL